MRGARGFVLVNALVMVAAMAAVAVALLIRAEDGRARAGAAVQAVQLELYLDAYEALARRLIDTDPGDVDHPGEGWARSDLELPLDRGKIAGELRDMQGRFNLNWLANSNDTPAQEAFDRLLASLGVAPRVGEQIRLALLPEPMGVTHNGPAEVLPGGPVLMIEQLPIPEAALLRLSPHVTVLPGSSTINVNTVTPQVMASFLPGANAAALDTVLSARRTEPFLSTDAFVDRVLAVMGAEQVAALDPDRLSVGSRWFEVTIAAELDGQFASRRVLLQRFALPEGAKVAYRVDTW